MILLLKLLVFGQIVIISCQNDLNRTENDEHVLERHKRQLLFPVATLIQFSACVATPVVLEKYIFFVNQGFQLNFGLPFRRNQLPVNFLAAVPTIDVARSRTKRSPPKPEVTSDIFYYFISQLVDTFGYNGTGCLLHSICELGKIPFHKDEDLMHEIIHFIMTPSEHDMPANFTQPILDYAKYQNKANITSFDHYLNAETLGKAGGDCDAEYRMYCPTSPLEFLSELVYEDVEDEVEEPINIVSEKLNSL